MRISENPKEIYTRLSHPIRVFIDADFRESERLNQNLTERGTAIVFIDADFRESESLYRALNSDLSAGFH